MHFFIIRQVDGDGLGAGIGVAAVIQGEVGIEIRVGARTLMSDVTFRVDKGATAAAASIGYEEIL